jgi:hypothetical protein
MKGKSVFVLMRSEPDWVSVEVYETEKDAIEALKELAEEYGMELESYSAYSSDSFASVEEKEIQ